MFIIFYWSFIGGSIYILGFYILYWIDAAVYDLMLVGSCPSALVRSFLQVRVLLNPSIRVPNGSVLYAYCCNVLFWNFMLGVGNVMQLHDSLLNSHWSTFALYFGLAYCGAVIWWNIGSCVCGGSGSLQHFIGWRSHGCLFVDSSWMLRWNAIVIWKAQVLSWVVLSSLCNLFYVPSSLLVGFTLL